VSRGLTAQLVVLLLGLCATDISARTVTYYYVDQQGSVLAKTDAQGNLIESDDYRSYGASATDGSPGGVAYAGHVADDDTSLSYMQARYYDPVVGRFLSVDPDPVAAGDVYGFNRYAYVSDNPANRIDPDGRREVNDAAGGEFISHLPWERDRFREPFSSPMDPCPVCMAKGSDGKKKAASKDSSSSAALSFSEVFDIVKDNNNSGQSDYLVVAVIWKESGFDPNIKSSSSSATGLMQMTRAAASQVGFSHSQMTDPAKNVQAGTSYMKYWIDGKHGDVAQGLTYYGDRTANYAAPIIKAAEALRLHPEKSVEILSAIHP